MSGPSTCKPSRSRSRRNGRPRPGPLERHGARPEKIEFLRSRRCELNMLPGRRFLDFVQRKLALHGVTKCIPEEEMLRLHLRRSYEHQLAQELLAQLHFSYIQSAS